MHCKMIVEIIYCATKIFSLSMNCFFSLCLAEVDVVALVQCTSPFIQVSDLDEACEKMESGFDSVFSVTRSHALRWAEDDSG